jgi:hypothetical protein
MWNPGQAGTACGGTDSGSSPSWSCWPATPAAGPSRRGLNGPEGHGLFRGDGGHPHPEPAEAITAELLRAAGVAVTGVHVDQLDAGSPAVMDAPAGAIARRRAGLGDGGWCGAASHPVSGRIVSGAACEASGK